MNDRNIVILKLNRYHCRRDICNNLPNLIQKNFPNASCNQVTNWRAFQTLIVEPTCIFLQFRAQPSLLHNLAEVKSRWKEVPIFGIFCERHDSTNQLDYKYVSQLNDFLLCPFQEIDLLLRFQKYSYAEKSLLLEVPNKNEGRFQYNGLIGKSPSFLEAVHKIPFLGKSDATTLICGETGTGKELFARAIHYHSPRSSGPFIPVNCGALPDHLFENELFGHTKGAFTDAGSEQKGLVQEAEGGTLFLDEIDTLSPAAQIKLLRFLQDQQYRPLGSSKNLKAHVRVLAATNRDVKYLVQNNLFREDLYFRINTLTLRLPPLKERTEDISLLANYFLDRAGKVLERSTMTLSPNTLTKLAAYAWPGNARELEAIIQRAVTFCDSNIVEPEDIDLTMEGLDPIKEGCLRKAKKTAIEQFERTYLINLLTTHQGNISQAAKAAGKERRSFQRLLRKYEIARELFLRST